MQPAATADRRTWLRRATFDLTGLPSHSVQDKVHAHDLHATILHLMGFDHEQHTYRYGGRDYRLTDVDGHVVREIIT